MMHYLRYSFEGHPPWQEKEAMYYEAWCGLRLETPEGTTEDKSQITWKGNE